MVSDIRVARIGDTIESVRTIGGKHLRMACDTHGAVKHANTLLEAGTWRLVERRRLSRDWLLRMADAEDAAGGIPSAGDMEPGR